MKVLRQLNMVSRFTHRRFLPNVSRFDGSVCYGSKLIHQTGGILGKKNLHLVNYIPALDLLAMNKIALYSDFPEH